MPGGRVTWLSVSEPAKHREPDLSEEARARLEDADRDLSAAVATYERLVGGTIPPGEPSPEAGTDDMRAAQAAVESAEGRLWKLREELLEWPRPPWAPRATLIADWFSDEDAVYDRPEHTVS